MVVSGPIGADGESLQRFQTRLSTALPVSSSALYVEGLSLTLTTVCCGSSIDLVFWSCWRSWMALAKALVLRHRRGGSSDGLSELDSLDIAQCTTKKCSIISWIDVHKAAAGEPPQFEPATEACHLTRSQRRALPMPTALPCRRALSAPCTLAIACHMCISQSAACPSAGGATQDQARARSMAEWRTRLDGARSQHAWCGLHACGRGRGRRSDAARRVASAATDRSLCVWPGGRATRECSKTLTCGTMLLWL